MPEQLTSQFNSAKFQELSVDCATGMVRFRDQSVKLTPIQAQIFAFIVSKAGSPYSLDQLAEALDKKDDNVKVQIFKMRKTLEQITLCPQKSITGESLILTDKIWGQNFAGNLTAEIYLNTHLLNLLSISASLDKVRTQAIAEIRSPNNKALSGVFSYADLKIDTVRGKIQYQEQAIDVGLSTGQVLALLINNPINIYSYDDVQKELEKDKTHIIQLATNLRTALRQIDLGEGLTGEAFFFTDKIYNTIEKRITSRELYLNTALLDALKDGCSIHQIIADGKIRTQHWGNEKTSEEIVEFKKSGLIQPVGMTGPL